MNPKHCIGILLLACAPAAVAGEIESFFLGGYFNDPLSWNGPVPDETVTCIFDIDKKLGPFVQFDEDGVSGRLVIRAGNPYFIMWDNDGEGFVSRQCDAVNPSFNTPSVVIAQNALESATLLVSHGYLNAQSVMLGMGVGSFGALEFSVGIDDLSAGLACVYELHVGGSGQGVVTIEHGAVITAAETVLGVGAGSIGDVVVTDHDSRLDVDGPLTVGRQGQGSLTINDRADVTSTSAMIGQQFGSDGTVTVTGLGASWTIDGSLDVGFQGQGTLAVTGGAAVFTHGFAVIGSFPEPVFPPVSGGLGDVTISGPASLWMVDGDLYVGLQWIGTLDILDGATVTSQSGIVGTSDQPGNVANVEGPGTVWGVIDDVTVFADSLLRIADDAIVLASLVDGLADSTIEAAGTIVGDVSSLGTIRIGDPIGVLDVLGEFTTGGELQIDIAEPFPDGFDTVSVSGNAVIGGTLTVSVADGYEPQDGDAFDIMTSPFIIGAFQWVILPATSAAGTWHYAQHGQSLEVFLTPQGDIDGDGVVGINDFLLLLGAWGPCFGPPLSCPEDLNGDGTVGINDLLILLAQWSE
jgi:T5SS/PEP-CTERM-associated repeat protein